MNTEEFKQIVRDLYNNSQDSVTYEYPALGFIFRKEGATTSVLQEDKEVMILSREGAWVISINPRYDVFIKNPSTNLATLFQAAGIDCQSEEEGPPYIKVPVGRDSIAIRL